MLDTLVFNKQLNQFEQNIDILNKKVEIGIDSDNETSAKEVGIKIVNWVTENFIYINEQIAEKLIKLKNENWLEEGEDEITQEAFVKQINLDSIQVYPDKEFELYYSDGDIFWGHSIVVDIDDQFIIQDINIAG